MPKSPIIAEDIANWPILGDRKEIYALEGIKSLLIVPLTVRGASLRNDRLLLPQPAPVYRGRGARRDGPFQPVRAAIGSAQLYEELRANDQRKDEFLAMLAHELRNPLAVIDTAVALLGVSNSGHEHTGGSVEVIGRHVRHLTRLIDDLLDVSRITTGKDSTAQEHDRACPVFKSAIESVRPMIEERKHRLRTSFGMNLILEADPTRLEQIAVNLLSNAAKYTQSGGQIWFTAQREQMRSSSACGIPEPAFPPTSFPGYSISLCRATARWNDCPEDWASV